MPENPLSSPPSVSDTLATHEPSHQFQIPISEPVTHIQHKESMLCHTDGPLYVWMSLIPLDATIHLAASKHTVGEPNIWRHLNIQGASKHAGGIQTYGGIQMYGEYGHPLSLTKHAFFVLCMYRGHPNIIQIYGGI